MRSIISDSREPLKLLLGQDKGAVVGVVVVGVIAQRLLKLSILLLHVQRSSQLRLSDNRGQLSTSLPQAYGNVKSSLLRAPSLKSPKLVPGTFGTGRARKTLLVPRLTWVPSSTVVLLLAVSTSAAAFAPTNGNTHHQASHKRRHALSREGYEFSQLLTGRSPALCPMQNTTIYTTSAGQQYEIYCDVSFLGDDIPALTIDSYEDCISACDEFVQDIFFQGGANCIGVVYGTNINPEVGNCYPKYQIESANWDAIGIEAARRVQYEIGGGPIYSAFSSIGPTTLITPKTSAPTTTSGFAPPPPTTVTIVAAPTIYSISPAASLTPAISPQPASSPTLQTFEASQEPTTPSMLPVSLTTSPERDPSPAISVAPVVDISSLSSTISSATTPEDVPHTTGLPINHATSISASPFLPLPPFSIPSSMASSSSPDMTQSSKPPTAAIVGVTIGAMAGVISLATLLFVIYQRKKNKRRSEDNLGAGELKELDKTGFARNRSGIWRLGIHELGGPEPPELDGVARDSVRKSWMRGEGV
ncbi:hypothetical protein MMC25_002578 [Agyrium rufum]|nr:hypothetical protein [Agyrium rufum]